MIISGPELRVLPNIRNYLPVLRLRFRLLCFVGKYPHAWGIIPTSGEKSQA